MVTKVTAARDGVTCDDVTYAMFAVGRILLTRPALYRQNYKRKQTPWLGYRPTREIVQKMTPTMSELLVNRVNLSWP